MMPPDASAPLDFAAFATKWQGDGISKLLGFVWAGYDELRRESPTTLNPRDEINVNSHLESRIHRKMPKNCPFDFQHTPPELSRRRTASRPPPSPDFGFFPWSDRRAMFPLEAKVLQTAGGVSEYLKALRTRFLQCRYAPNSSEGVMIGYLLSGDDEVTFKKLRTKLRTALENHPDFYFRPHRISEHQRKHRRCKDSPPKFRCHHLIMAFARGA
jgi:hypothetical protein